MPGRISRTTPAGADRRAGQIRSRVHGRCGRDARRQPRGAAAAGRNTWPISSRSRCSPATAAVTRHIGLVCTAIDQLQRALSTSRACSRSLDHISGGRAGWNVVTSANRVRGFNFSRDEHYDIGERYRARPRIRPGRARAVGQLGRRRVRARPRQPPLLRSRTSCTSSITRASIFSVRGPLNVARPPQGYPVIAQAGASEDRQGTRRPDRRGHFLLPATRRGRARVLPRRQGTDGEIRPRAVDNSRCSPD